MQACNARAEPRGLYQSFGGHLGISEGPCDAAIAQGLLGQPQIRGFGSEPVGQNLPRFPVASAIFLNPN